MEPQNNSQKNVGIFVGIIVIIGVVLVTLFSENKSSTSSTQNNTPVTSVQDSSNSVGTVSPAPSNNQIPPQNYPTPAPPAPSPVTTQTPVADIPKQPASVYRNGTYSATGSYMSPGGYE